MLLNDELLTAPSCVVSAAATAGPGQLCRNDLCSFTKAVRAELDFHFVLRHVIHSGSELCALLEVVAGTTAHVIVLSGTNIVAR